MACNDKTCSLCWGVNHPWPDDDAKEEYPQPMGVSYEALTILSPEAKLSLLSHAMYDIAYVAQLPEDGSPMGASILKIARLANEALRAVGAVGP
jgi:hypothetical protein